MLQGFPFLALGIQDKINIFLVVLIVLKQLYNLFSHFVNTISVASFPSYLFSTQPPSHHPLPIPLISLAVIPNLIGNPYPSPL